MRNSGPSLLSIFFWAILSFFILPIFCPFIKISYLSPFLASLFYKTSYPLCLSLAFSSGLLQDLYASQTPLGNFALVYTLTVMALWKKKQHFFADNPSTLPIMTYLASLTSSLFDLSLRIFFQKKTFCRDAFLSDFFLYPLLDAIYAWLFFGLCLQYMRYRPKILRQR